MTLSADQLALVLLAHAAATLIMVGAIWVVQRVHYPLFTYVDAARWRAFHAEHGSRITPVVGPTMVIELVTSALLSLAWPGRAPVITHVGFGLALVTWIATALVAVPIHHRLGTGFDASLARRLVVTNWIRTLAWTARGGVALWLLRSAG
jgi:hypothetical protein